MKTTAPFDASFARTLDDQQAWLYQDLSVHSACLSWMLLYGFNLVEFDDYLQEDGWDSPAAKANQAMLIQRRAQALQARKDGNNDLAFAWLNFMALAKRTIKHMEVMTPLSKTGKKFVAGRKQDAIGPLRAAIRRYLKSHPKAKTAEIWSALKAKPPKGMTFFDNRQGKYIERDDKTSDVTYRGFTNMISKERATQALNAS